MQKRGNGKRVKEMQSRVKKWMIQPQKTGVRKGCSATGRKDETWSIRLWGKRRETGRKSERIDVSKRAQLALDWCDSSTYDAQSASRNMLCRDMQKGISLSLLSEKRTDYLALHLTLSVTDFCSQRMESSTCYPMKLNFCHWTDLSERLRGVELYGDNALFVATGFWCYQNPSTNKCYMGF